MQSIDNVNVIWPNWYSDGMIGKGSYGEVIRIKSKENEQQRSEAVKILRFPQDLSEIRELQNRGIDAEEFYHEIAEKAKKEIVMMSKLQEMNAENVVNIKDHKMIENGIQRIIYIRMELLDSLENNRNIILKQKDKIVDSVVKLGIDICTALSNCEKLSIIHRDIKPSNIFVDKNGTYKLGDFGVSKQEIDKTRGMMTQQGTPMYEAPEVYRGDNYDHTIDVYSLGLVMYEMLNQGRLPYYPLPPKKVTFNDINIATFKRMNKENEMAGPSEADERLSKIILKACSYEPRYRYQSAKEMKKDLQDYQKRTIISNNDKKELFDQTRSVIESETPLEKDDDYNNSSSSQLKSNSEKNKLSFLSNSSEIIKKDNDKLQANAKEELVTEEYDNNGNIVKRNYYKGGLIWKSEERINGKIKSCGYIIPCCFQISYYDREGNLKIKNMYNENGELVFICIIRNNGQLYGVDIPYRNKSSTNICDEKGEKIFETFSYRNDDGEYIFSVDDYRLKGKVIKDNIVGKPIKIGHKNYRYELGHLDWVQIYDKKNELPEYALYSFEKGRISYIVYNIPIYKVFLIRTWVDFCYDGADNTLNKIKYRILDYGVYKKEYYENKKMVKRVIYPEKIDNNKLKLIYKILKNTRE